MEDTSFVYTYVYHKCPFRLQEFGQLQILYENLFKKQGMAQDLTLNTVKSNNYLFFFRFYGIFGWGLDDLNPFDPGGFDMLITVGGRVPIYLFFCNCILVKQTFKTSTHKFSVYQYVFLSLSLSLSMCACVRVCVSVLISSLFALSEFGTRFTAGRGESLSLLYFSPF